MGGMKNLFGDEPFDATQSRAARDAGLNLVHSNNSAWLDSIIFLIGSLPPGWCGTGEDIRRLSHNCGKPKHHNAWGAVVAVAIKRKLLTRTGRRLKMKSVRSHARQTDEYRRT